MEGLARRIEGAYTALDPAIKNETLSVSRWYYFSAAVLGGCVGQW